jgi:hypothetical protein
MHKCLLLVRFKELDNRLSALRSLISSYFELERGVNTSYLQL